MSSARKASTKIIFRKNGTVSVVRHGKVQFNHRDLDAVEAFLRGFDPQLAAARAARYAERHARAA